MDRVVTSILSDLRLLHLYTTHRDVFIASVLDLINEFQECSEEEVMFSSDEDFAKFLHDKVYKEILMKDNSETNE